MLAEEEAALGFQCSLCGDVGSDGQHQSRGLAGELGDSQGARRTVQLPAVQAGTGGGQWGRVKHGGE